MEAYALIEDAVTRHQAAVRSFFAHNTDLLVMLGQQAKACLARGNTLLFCGNGGSACDAMHIAGEFVGRYVKERRGLPAIALSADSGILTAVGNDYGFERIYARQVEALGREGDMLFAMSTSGSSPNILVALEQARRQGIRTILLTGERGRAQQGKADQLVVVESTVTATIQEVHIVALHLLAALIESDI